MKTLIPLTFATFATIALTFATLNVSGEALLSPRAQDNQIKTVAVSDKSPNTVTQNQNVIASPRVLATQTKIAKGTDTSPSTIAAGCATGSPNQLAQAGKFTSGDCCKVTSIACSTPKACCGMAGK